MYIDTHTHTKVEKELSCIHSNTGALLFSLLRCKLAGTGVKDMLAFKKNVSDSKRLPYQD